MGLKDCCTIYAHLSGNVDLSQELTAAGSGASSEELLKRRCAVMMELSGTLARVLEFCTARLASLFLSGPQLNITRLAETACFVVAHAAAPASSEAIAGILALKLPSSQASQSLKRATLLAPVLGVWAPLISL